MSQVKRFYHTLNHANSDDPESCMVESNSGLYVRYQDVVGVILENSLLKASISGASDQIQCQYDTDGFEVYDSEGNFTDVGILLNDAKGIVEKLTEVETPSTDAYLNSVRAEGIEMVLKLYKSERHLVADEDMAQYDFALSHLALMIVKLRAGEPS